MTYGGVLNEQCLFCAVYTCLTVAGPSVVC